MSAAKAGDREDDRTNGRGFRGSAAHMLKTFYDHWAWEPEMLQWTLRASLLAAPLGVLAMRCPGNVLPPAQRPRTVAPPYATRTAECAWTA